MSIGLDLQSKSLPQVSVQINSLEKQIQVVKINKC